MASKEQPLFVVHQHQGSRLHYDLQLEYDGVLKSWQVPRGVSMDPSVRRFALEGKDVPLDRAAIEGDARQKISIWDSGTLEFSGGDAAFKRGLLKGRLTFVLRGTKLHGAFSMYRFVGRKRWLLFKRQDKYAMSEEAPSMQHRLRL